MNLDLEHLTLKAGSHPNRDEVCVMEAVAWFAGEPHSFHPQCVSPIITTFLMSWNDSLNDDDRQQLKRWIPEVVGTNAGPEVDIELSWMALDWLIRVQTPAWLRLAGLTEQAETLASMGEVTPISCPSILPALQAGRSDADAARAAARDAAWYAAAQCAAQYVPTPTVVELQASAHELVGRMVAHAKQAVAS